MCSGQMFPSSHVIIPKLTGNRVGVMWNCIQLAGKDAGVRGPLCHQGGEVVERHLCEQGIFRRFNACP